MTFNHQLAKVKLILFHYLGYIHANGFFIHYLINLIKYLHVHQICQKFKDLFLLCTPIQGPHFGRVFGFEFLGLPWIIILDEFKEILVVIHIRFLGARAIHLVDELFAELARLRLDLHVWGPHD